MHYSKQSFLSAKFEARDESKKGGRGVFCLIECNVGELVASWDGVIIDLSEVAELNDDELKRIIQISDDSFDFSPKVLPQDYLNHSCEPNLGFDSNGRVIAIKKILPGEEACFDYAMCDSAPVDEFICACGSNKCRGWIRGDDWKSPDLQEKYDGYFMPYLQKKINELKLTNTKIHV